MVCLQKSVSCAIVGDCMIGKTSMVKSFVGDKVSEEYVATVADTYTGYITAYGDQYLVNIRDTNGLHEDVVSMSTIVSSSDVTVMCYSAVDRNSFENVKSFWIAEIRKYNKKKPLVLVATQSDLREENNPVHITDSEGQELTRQIRAKYYNKCSATVNFGMKNVFESAVLASVKFKKKKTNIFQRVFWR